MATKGQKFKTFTNEERTEIVSKYMSGKYSYAILAKEYNISWKTVESMVRKFKKTGLTIKDKKGRNNQSHLTKEDWKERYEILKKYQAFLKAQREKKDFRKSYMLKQKRLVFYAQKRDLLTTAYKLQNYYRKEKSWLESA